MSVRRIALQRGSSEGVTSDAAMLPYIKFSVENIEPYYLPPDLEEIAQQPLPRYDFHTEIELLKRYEEIQMAERSKAAVIDSSAQPRSEVNPETEGLPSDPSGRAAVEGEFAIKRGLVQELSEEMKEPEEVCEFYLESSEWNYSKAKEMMTEMKN